MQFDGGGFAAEVGRHGGRRPPLIQDERPGDFLVGIFITGLAWFSRGLVEGGLEEFLQHFELSLGADYLLVDELLALGLVGDLGLELCNA